MLVILTSSVSDALAFFFVVREKYREDGLVLLAIVYLELAEIRVEDSVRPA